MARSLISSRGQTVIPKQIRDRLGLGAGDEVEFLVRDANEVVMKPVTRHASELKGVLFAPGRKPVSDAAIRQAIRRRGARQ